MGSTCLKKAHFLRKLGHESAQTRLRRVWVHGRNGKKTYGGYKGRGLMQLTYKDAYENTGHMSGKDFCRQQGSVGCT